MTKMSRTKKIPVLFSSKIYKMKPKIKEKLSQFSQNSNASNALTYGNNKVYYN